MDVAAKGVNASIVIVKIVKNMTAVALDNDVELMTTAAERV